MDNSLDMAAEMPDNVNNDLDVVVKMDEQVPIHDTECKHKTLIPDPTDTIGDAVYHGCSNKECIVGFYIRPK